MRHSNSAVPALAVGFALIAGPLAAFGGEAHGGAPQSSQPVKAVQPAKAEQPPAPHMAVDRFTATTTGVTPQDVTLRFDLLRWSDESGRADVVAALGAPDPIAALSKLPTQGYIWLSTGPVGAGVKYAHRSATPDGERITFVTDKRLDYYDFKKWAPTPPLAAKDTSYGVVELYLDSNGQGTGTFSLAADVVIDAANAQVSLADGAPRLLANAKMEPKPYSEQASASASN